MGDLTPRQKVNTVVGLVVSLGLVLLGFWLMGQAWEHGEELGLPIFSGGMLSISLGIWVSVWLVPKLD